MSSTSKAQARQERRDKIARMTRQGMSQYAIAEEIGVSRSLVQKEQRIIRAEGGADTAHRRSPRAVAIAKPSNIQNHGTSAMSTIMPPPDYQGAWRRHDLDRDTWSKASPAELMSMIINVSPEASRAVWDWLRLVNSGHRIVAFKPGTEDQDERAQAVLDEFIGRLESYYGSFKVVAGRLYMGAITRGAFFAELVLDQTGRIPLDIATPDPATVRFKLVEVPDRGEVWIPGQWQDGKFVTFDVPTVKYIALDPESDSPYGRPMIAPAIFPTVFLIGVLHDLRRVISQQGYPRTDVVIRLEALRVAYAELDDEEFGDKVDELILEIKREIANLEPDDAFVHTDPVEVDRASGAVDSSAMRGAAAVIEALERLATRALKTMPLLMGSVDGTGDANANRQWEIHAAGVRTLQHYAESILGSLLGIALRVQGINADVRVRFAEIRAAEELRDAQTFMAKLRGAELAEKLGYYTAEEAAEHATGHGIPEEIRDERVPLLNQSTGGGSSVTSSTQVDGNESDGSNDRVFMDRATRLPDVDEVRIEAAVQSWRNVFADAPLENLLDAEVIEA